MKISIDKEYEGERVDKVLSKILNISRSSLDNVDISCNGKIIKGSYKLKENDIIEFELNEKNDEINEFRWIIRKRFRRFRKQIKVVIKF